MSIGKQDLPSEAIHSSVQSDSASNMRTFAPASLKKKTGECLISLSSVIKYGGQIKTVYQTHRIHMHRGTVSQAGQTGQRWCWFDARTRLHVGWLGWATGMYAQVRSENRDKRVPWNMLLQPFTGWQRILPDANSQSLTCPVLKCALLRCTEYQPGDIIASLESTVK